jgi:hypothetical protein
MGGGLIIASICTIISLVRVCSDEAGWDVHFLCAALTVWRIMHHPFAIVLAVHSEMEISQ